MLKNAVVTAAALAAGIVIGTLAPVLAEDQDPGTPGVAVDDPDVMFEAHRYEMVVFDSAMDFVHATGRKIVELHFPHTGIVCNLEESQLQGVVMNAFYGERRDVLDEKVVQMLGENAPKQGPPEVVEVPKDLYLRIRWLADVTRDRTEYATKLKADLQASKLFTLGE